MMAVMSRRTVAGKLLLILWLVYFGLYSQLFHHYMVKQFFNKFRKQGIVCTSKDDYLLWRSLVRFFNYNKRVCFIMIVRMASYFDVNENIKCAASFLKPLTDVAILITVWVSISQYYRYFWHKMKIVKH